MRVRGQRRRAALLGCVAAIAAVVGLAAWWGGALDRPERGDRGRPLRRARRADAAGRPGRGGGGRAEHGRPGHALAVLPGRAGPGPDAPGGGATAGDRVRHPALGRDHRGRRPGDGRRAGRGRTGGAGHHPVRPRERPRRPLRGRVDHRGPRRVPGHARQRLPPRAPGRGGPALVRRRRRRGGLGEPAPSGAAGGSALIDYAGPPGTIPALSYADVLAGRFDAGAVRDRVVVVGTTSPRLGDTHPTPYGGEPMSGPRSTPTPSPP